MGLTPGQEKLDKNKDGKISGSDFKMMKGGGLQKLKLKAWQWVVKLKLKAWQWAVR